MNLLAVILALLVLFFSLATVLFNFPENYLAVRLDKFVGRIMLPYFSQSWSLFAPNPGGWNPDAAFRLGFTNRRGGLIITPWYDGNALFPASDNGNPFNRLGLEREIYFGEILIATNDIARIRKVAAHMRVSPRAPVAMNQIPNTLWSVHRLFMSLAPGLVPRGYTAYPYLIQIALSEYQPPRFAERFGLKKGDWRHASQASSATLVLPWVEGDVVAPFARLTTVKAQR